MKKPEGSYGIVVQDSENICFIDSYAEGPDGGIHISGSKDVTSLRSKFVTTRRNEIAVFLRDRGLPEDTNPILLSMALREMITGPVEQRESKARRLVSAVFQGVKDGMDLTLKICQLASDPKINQIIDWLDRLTKQ